MTFLPPGIAEIETVSDGRRAALLVQHPLRPQILNVARVPISATEIAALLGESRQKIGYHVRQLRRAGFLRAAGRRRKRGLVEHRFVASATAYVLSPNVTGAASLDASRLTAGALGLERDLRFATRQHRTAFAAALREAIERLVSEHATGLDAGAHAATSRLLVFYHPTTEKPEVLETDS